MGPQGAEIVALVRVTLVFMEIEAKSARDLEYLVINYI